MVNVILSSKVSTEIIDVCTWSEAVLYLRDAPVEVKTVSVRVNKDGINFILKF